MEVPVGCEFIKLGAHGQAPLSPGGALRSDDDALGVAGFCPGRLDLAQWDAAGGGVEGSRVDFLGEGLDFVPVGTGLDRALAGADDAEIDRTQGCRRDGRLQAGDRTDLNPGQGLLVARTVRDDGVESLAR